MNDVYEHYRELEAENAELRKRVDELTDKLGKVLINVKLDELLAAKSIEQVIKYAAKKYHDAVQKLFEKFDCCGCIEDRSTALWYEDNDTIAKEQFDVEVE